MHGEPVAACPARGVQRLEMNSTKKKHPHGHVGGHHGAKRKKDKSPKQPRAPKLHILACHGIGRVDAFLNLHKKCNAPAQALESFRVSRLLSSSALVVSERACAADEREFEGLADFAAAAHLADVYLGIANKSRAEREAIAGERAARFATRFAPEALLRRAGVDALLRDLIARTSQKRST